MESRRSESGVFVMDALEPRRLLAEATSIVVIQWGGQQIEMRQGEWIVGLTAPGSTYEEATGEWTFNGTRSRSTAPSESLKPALKAAEEIGVEFDRYLGSEDVFSIRVPDGVSYEQLLDVMDDVPELRYVEPNAVFRIDDLPAIPLTPPDAPRSELELVPVEVGTRPASGIGSTPPSEVWGMSAVSLFSQNRVGGSDLLDGETEEDLLS